MCEAGDDLGAAHTTGVACSCSGRLAGALGGLLSVILLHTL
jgi:hypothetical protein